MSYERILIVGNLGNAPELRTSAKDAQPVVTLSVAVNRKRGDQRTVTWYRVTAWGATAEQACQYLRKGSKLLVEGSNLRVSSYLDQAGKPQASLELTADRLIFLDSAPENGANGGDAGDLAI